MKILYCMCSLYNPGGMERVLLNKVRYLKERMGWDVAVVTTDQHGKPTFYPFPDGVRIIDLGVNYTDDNGKNPVVKTIGYLWRRRKHRKALTELLLKERPDIVDSLYPSESRMAVRRCWNCTLTSTSGFSTEGTDCWDCQIG